MKYCLITFLLSTHFLFLSGMPWNEPAGPQKNWTVTTNGKAITNFSVSNNQNISWKLNLPEIGQGGITIWKNLAFLTTLEPILKTTEKENLKSSNILALCIDLNQKKIIWQRKIEGSLKSPYAYGFSDSTSPGPITDGKRVWFYNASGKIVCYDLKGEKLWERVWNPIDELNGVHYPFNKQFEPLSHKNTILNLEPYLLKDGKRVYGWNYIVALDKLTGHVKWISEDSLTQYNTPCYSTTADGRVALLIGRGGHHSVPESPHGYSLIDLDNGKTIWKYKTTEGTALFNSTWNSKIALWFTEKENLVHKLDSNSGKLLKKLSLTDNVDLRTYIPEKEAYHLEKNINLKEKYNTDVFPAWYSNIIVGNYCYFYCFKKNKRLKTLGPEYCVGRLHLTTGKAEYLEVPVHTKYTNGKKECLWAQEVSSDTTNSNGIDIAYDKRSKRDGWVWNFNGNPIVINNVLYFSLMSGVVYCIDTQAEVFDEKALLGVNDIGTVSKTWSLNTPSFSHGKLYHRTAKELICIEEK